MPWVMNDFMIADVAHSSDGSVVQAALPLRVWSACRKPRVCPSSWVTALLKSPLLKRVVQLAIPWFISTSPSSVVKKVSLLTTFDPDAEVIPPRPSVPPPLHENGETPQVLRSRSNSTVFAPSGLCSP